MQVYVPYIRVHYAHGKEINGDFLTVEKKTENHFGGKMPESVKAELCSSKNVPIVIQKKKIKLFGAACVHEK